MIGFLARTFTQLGRAIASFGYGNPGQSQHDMIVAAEFTLDAVQTWTAFTLDAD